MPAPDAIIAGFLPAMTPRSLPATQWIIRQDAADGAAWFVK
jgi:hypothetical protein